MCKVVINRLMLGSRELGWELFTGKEIIEMTSMQVKAALKNSATDIVGLCLDDKGELQLEKEKYFCNNIMCKVHIGTLKPLIEDELVMMNIFYYVFKSYEQDGETLYDVVSSRFARETLKKDKLMALYELGIIGGGIKVENGNIIAFDRQEKVTVSAEQKTQEVKSDIVAKQELPKIVKVERAEPEVKKK